MTNLVKTYLVKVVREPGINPITGKMMGRAEEDMTIDATSPQAAHRIAQMKTTLKFSGQEMVVYIDGERHLDAALQKYSKEEKRKKP